MVHLILLTVHRPQPHRLPEISIFVLFICVNAVVIGISLSGLRRGDDPADQNPGWTTYERPAASIISRIWFSVPRGKARVDLMVFSSVVYEASVKGTAVVVSIDYTVLAIAGLLFWRGIRGIPSQGPVICEVTIHALLVLVTAGFAAGGLVHDWPFWIEVMLIIAIGAYMARNNSTHSGEPGNTVPLANFTDNTSDLGQLSPHQESRSARLPFMTEESYTQLDEVRTARPESAHLKIRAVASIYYPDRPILETGIFAVLCEGSEGDYRRDLRYDELTACSDGEAAIQSYRLGFISILAFIPAVESHTEKLVVRLDASTSQKRRTLEYTNGYFRHGSKRKRTSTLAMRENAEPNKRTDRSQDRDDDQTTAHVPQTEIGRKRRTEVRQRLRLYCCTNNQTRAVPATLSQAIEIDEDPETETDSVLEMLPYSKPKQKWREQQQKRQTWVNRAIKCCSCEVTGSAVNKCACGHEFCHAEMEPNSLGARQSTTCSTRQRRYRDRNFTGCSTCKARHVKCDEAAPACRNCIKRGLHCDGARLYRFVNPGSVKGEYKAFRGKTDHQLQTTVSPAHTHRHIRIQLPPAYGPLQSGIHASTESLAMDIEPINPTAGDGKPPLQYTLNDEARDLESHSSSYNPYSIDEANWYSEYPNIRGDVFHGNEEVPLTFIVCISEPVLQEQLKYLKAHTSHLHFVFGAFSENSFDGPLALPYALCLLKILRQHAGQQLSEKRLDDTIQFLSTRLRGLLSTPLFNTGRGRISRVSLLFRRQVFHKRPPRPLWPEESWKRSTVWGFTLDGNLTLTLFLDGQYRFKVPDEVWNGFSSLDSGIADVAVIFGVG
ncbi:predicted protein [Histoplasma mississippiense (nom. inval.)]|uniref:predicted protein n=1 Tax=Ajellomyces capsulatus (strain NAm1 / WU24) TaxID=2059318 RepID=UPI000157D12A|nr:predicted protein [Histoplasma mississippiense (nom. inval.)]EDN11090.1 predicted protein [Histoplasma mississippiense (nom. inval.)]